MATDEELRRVSELTAEAVMRRTEHNAPTMKQIEEAAERAAASALEKSIGPIVDKAIAKTLLSFGLDTANPMDTMRDQMFLRDMRILSSDSKRHVVLAVLGIIAAGVATAVWAYTKGTGKLP